MYHLNGSTLHTPDRRHTADHVKQTDLAARLAKAIRDKNRRPEPA